MNNKILAIKHIGVKYGQEIDKVFNFLSEKQYKDKVLWKTLVFQFFGSVGKRHTRIPPFSMCPDRAHCNVQNLRKSFARKLHFCL